MRCINHTYLFLTSTLIWIIITLYWCYCIHRTNSTDLSTILHYDQFHHLLHTNQYTNIYVTSICRGIDVDCVLVQLYTLQQQHSLYQLIVYIGIDVLDDTQYDVIQRIRSINRNIVIYYIHNDIHHNIICTDQYDWIDKYTIIKLYYTLPINRLLYTPSCILYNHNIDMVLSQDTIFDSVSSCVAYNGMNAQSNIMLIDSGSRVMTSGVPRICRLDSSYIEIMDMYLHTDILHNASISMFISTATHSTHNEVVPFYGAVPYPHHQPMHQYPIKYWTWKYIRSLQYESISTSPSDSIRSYMDQIHEPITEQPIHDIITHNSQMLSYTSYCNHTVLYDELRDDQFSVLIGHYYIPNNTYRLQLLIRLIQHYRDMSLIHTIYITWHNYQSHVPQYMIDAINYDTQNRQQYNTLHKIPNVIFIHVHTNSLNNRFLPISTVSTRCVYISDDDIYVSGDALQLAYNVWKQSSGQLVGFFPRSHDAVNASTDYQWHYVQEDIELTREYSIVLTKGLFTHISYLYVYTCLTPLRIHQYIDIYMNGEDIAFQMAVSALTHLPPILVLTSAIDFGVSTPNDTTHQHHGISSQTNHYYTRNIILSDLAELYGNMTLQYSSHMIVQYHKPTVHTITN